MMYSTVIVEEFADLGVCNHGVLGSVFSEFDSVGEFFVLCLK